MSLNWPVRLAKAGGRPLHRFLIKPSVRASVGFRALQQVVHYLPQEDILSKAMAFTASCGIEGDYLEFGVYTGAAFTAAYHFARANQLVDMRFYAFDSFEGMPSFGQESGASRDHRPGGFACDRAGFERSIYANGVDPSRVEVVAGWYEDVLTDELRAKLPLEAAAIISADCGLYESTSCVLHFVDDYIQDGTIVIFGDWFSFRGSPHRGQQRAFSEWLAARPHITTTEFHKFGWHGTSYVLHRS